MGEDVAIGIEEADRPDVGLIEGPLGDAIELIVVTGAHGRRDKRRHLLGDQLAVLDELAAHVRQLDPAEVDPEQGRHAAGREDAQQQNASLESQFVQHYASPEEIGESNLFTKCKESLCERGRTPSRR